MNGKMLAALIGAIGGLVVGAVTTTASHYLGLEATRQEFLQEARREAYVDWLNARLFGLQAEQMLKAAQVKELDAKEREAAEAEAESLKEKFRLEGRQALSRIAVYGDRRVVGALAAWLRAFEYRKPCTFSRWTQDIKVYQSMRAAQFPKEDRVSDGDLSVMLFGCTEPN